MKLIQMSLLASTLVLFTACGGGDNDSESYVPSSWTGQIVDTYVKGLNYTCIGKVWDADGIDTGDTQITSTGVTNDKGEFTCNEGDVVEFSIGGYVIGETYAYNNAIKTPYDLSQGSEEGAINIAQLLQTIDDKSVNGVLTIPDNFTALNNITTTVTDPDFDALMADALSVTALVSEGDAQAHLDETLSTLTGVSNPIQDGIDNLKAFLSGQTLYNESLYEAWTFNTEVTSLYYVDIDAINVGPDNSGTEIITVLSGSQINLNGTIADVEIFDQYITISAGSISENLWFNLDAMNAALGF